MISVHAGLTARAVTLALYYRLVHSTKQLRFQNPTKLSMDSEWSRKFDGNLFQVLGPHTAKLRGPYVDVFVLCSLERHEKQNLDFCGL